MNNRDKAFCCIDCGKRGGLFWLKDEVWLKIWPSYWVDLKKIKKKELRHGILCFCCAENRMVRLCGREFKRSDFIRIGCNEIVFLLLEARKRELIY